MIQVVEFLFVALIIMGVFLFGIIYKKEQLNPIEDHPLTKEAKPVKKEYPKSTWKPKVPSKALNQIKWAGQGFSVTTKNECNNCENACWVTKGDPGGLTCVGVSLRANPEFYTKVLNRAWQICHRKGLYMPDDANPYGRIKDLCYDLRKYYWENYAEKYKNCTYNALIWLTDTSILSGPRSSALILQRASFIRPDGIWGPQTEAQCSAKNWEVNKKKFIIERRTYLSGLKKLKKFHNGWNKRIDNMIKEGL